MRKGIFILFILLFACSLGAQSRAGNIYGRVVDSEGNSLPGVSVTLTGSLTASVSAVTSAEGRFRFLSLSPAKDYELKAELQGFNTEIRKGIIVVVGVNVNLTITMVQGVLTEEVVVMAPTPVVDSKKTVVGLNVTQEMLQSLPTARDPWVILQMAPGVTIDRENIGGSDSGHQSLFAAKGAAGRDNNEYSMDGVTITAAGSPGSSPIYYDLDAFEEMNITVGGNDVTSQTGGVALNMVTKRGGNKVTLGGRFYLTDKNFQANNMTQALKDQGVAGINQIRRNRDFGFNVGLPLIKDKAWFWGSYGESFIQTTTIYGNNDDTTLTNLTAKLNLQIIPQNRLEVMVSGAEKYKYGGGQSSSNPAGIIQLAPYRFGVPLVKFQDEHTFGDNFFISLKYAWMDNSGGHVTVMDPDRNKLAIYDVTDQRWYDSMSTWWGKNLDNMFAFQSTYFQEKLFGVSHEIKFGADYNTHVAEPLYQGSFTGNISVSRNYNYPTVDFNGDGLPDIPNDPNFKYFSMERSKNSATKTTQFAGYISDTITFGRFNALLGLRYDLQTPSVNPYSIQAVEKDNPVWKNNVDSQTADLLDTVLPAIKVPKIEALAADGSKYRWAVWSPRIGLTWDVTGSGKTIAKLSLASYGDYMASYEGDTWKPGGVSGWMGFWWLDKGDGIVDYKELYWNTAAGYTPYRVFNDAGQFIGDYADAAGRFWGDYDPQNPTQTAAPYTLVDKDAGSSRTSEVILSLEKEILPNFAVQINGTFRRYNNFRWWLKYFPETGTLDNQSWYISAGNPPADIPGIGNTKEAQKHEWYYTSAEGSVYSPWYYVKTQPDAHNDYFGLDLVANKRLSDRWMLNANFTLQSQKAYYGKKGYLNPTNIWAFNGQAYSPSFGGGSGKIDQFVYSPWMLKITGLYQLPFDINVAGSFLARRGYIIEESFGIVDYRLPNPRSNSAGLDMTAFGTNHLPNSYILNLRLEKMIKLGDTGKIFLMADVFNALNSSTVNRREQKYYGTYYIYPDSSQNEFVPNTTNYNINEILNPRVTRFGVRFVF